MARSVDDIVSELTMIAEDTATTGTLEEEIPDEVRRKVGKDLAVTEMRSLMERLQRAKLSPSAPEWPTTGELAAASVEWRMPVSYPQAPERNDLAVPGDEPVHFVARLSFAHPRNVELRGAIALGFASDGRLVGYASVPAKERYSEMKFMGGVRLRDIRTSTVRHLIGRLVDEIRYAAD